MKMYLALIATAFTLSACGGNEPAQTQPAAQPAPVAASPVAAASESNAPSATNVPSECQIVINSDDAMKFDTQEIAIKSSCAQASITLNHTGKTPKAAMGHNVVIAAAADKAAIVADGASAKLENDYLKPNDNRVIAASKMVGGGESSTFTFKTDKLKNGDFEFFCTFPGHVAMMTGKVKIVD
ncbi:azurin [Alysiella filiformis]|uniref:Azurin n=1 Tax=Alysiella filiformis DSM 16848 TaxID=1120981 RepID=A0A286E6F8_9NEIS|nr:azurin [Alysiella filiformis]QMT31495.1 azurin [Alysiella filiformis]UBQ55493.1 azurin [Alysiella filiformis DSM 16848]SOD66492.1 azurin [Alysiella filiformis DSM 16848]